MNDSEPACGVTPTDVETRHPTLWETYNFIFQALESGRATVKEAREFHWLLLKGSLANDKDVSRLMRLREKLGIGMVRKGQLTLESLVSMAGQADPDTKVVSKKEKILSDGRKRIEVQIKFPDKPRNRNRSKPT